MNTTYTKSLKKFKVGTMCSGIGTPEIALKNLGIDFEVVYAAEIDKNARKTYLENHKVGTFYEDLTKIDMNELSYVDCFIMGFPCQSYSQQGLRLGLNDPRGTILFYGLEAIRRTKPQYVILENVKPFTTMKNGEYINLVVRELETIGYKVKWEVLNSKNFNTPQNRERVYIVGIREDLKQDFNFPEEQELTKSINDYMIKEDYTNYIIDSSKIETYIQKRNTELKRVGTDLKSSFESSQRVYSTEGISSCFTTSFNSKFFDTKNKIYRTLTEKEMSSIQGIPEDFKFPVKNTSIRKQVGNSMTVQVLEGLFTELMVGYYDLPKSINNVSYNECKELVC